MVVQYTFANSAAADVELRVAAQSPDAAQRHATGVRTFTNSCDVALICVLLAAARRVALVVLAIQA